MKLTVLKGLPASGKTTLAKEIILTEENTIRVNKDDLRSMLHFGEYSQKNEAVVIKIEEAIIREALLEDQNVIVDDTNFNPAHIVRCEHISYEYGAELEVIDLMEKVDLLTCMMRDSKREKSVGHKAIAKMYAKYITNTPDEEQFAVFNILAIAEEIEKARTEKRFTVRYYIPDKESDYDIDIVDCYLDSLKANYQHKHNEFIHNELILIELAT
jgi:predicted kinase